MDEIKQSIMELPKEDWTKLYRWAVREERTRREQLAAKEALIQEILEAEEAS